MSAPPSPYHAPAPEQQPRRPSTTRPLVRRAWGPAVAVGALSALLASGGTYAVVAQQGALQPTVVEAGPAAAPTAEPVAFAPAQDWAGVAAAVTPSVVSIDVSTPQGEGTGSGVVWDGEGHVVTNAHVVGPAEQVSVVLADGRTYEADVVGTDPATDLAVVRLVDPPADLSPIAVSSDAEVGVGDPVMAVGNPLGLSGTVTTGIVSALDRPVTTQSTATDPATGAAATVVTNAVQTSAAINPGNSGGALVDASGRLIGINSSIASLPTMTGGPAGSIGIGFAIPVDGVSSVVGQLLEDGTVEHAFLGVALADAQAEEGSATVGAAGITAVEPGSPAEAAGLQEGDAIVDIDGERVPDALSLVAQVRQRSTGHEVVLRIVSDGERREVTVTLDARPDDL